MFRAIGLFLCLVSVSDSTFGAPAVRFEQSHVLATGITPRGRVVIVGVAHEPRQFWTSIAHRQSILTDTNGSGTVRLDLQVPLAPDSGWIVVDLTTGEVATGAPEESPFQLVMFPADSLRRNGAGEFATIVAEEEYIDLVLVRPGEGAWLFFGDDGHSNDRDGQRNGRTTIEPEGMRPIGNSPPAPKHLKNGDRLIAIAPYARTIATVEVGR